MKKLTTAVLLAGGMMSASASAALMFDQNVTPDVIFGSGNANGSFTTEQANGIEVGLRGKLRHDPSGNPQNIFNSNGDGTYSFDAGLAPTPSSATSPLHPQTAVWSFEWSINSDFDGSGAVLDTYTYMLSIDKDPSAAVDYLMFDPINDGNPGAGGAVFWDHAIGTNATGNGGGTSATSAGDYATKIGNNNLAQNSWKPHWFIGAFGFDPTVDGTYDISLCAKDGGITLASSTIQIIVGAGATIPEPGTMAILLTGLLGLAARKKFAK